MQDNDGLPTTLREWRDVLLRMQQMTRNDQGATVLTIKLLCVRGQPAYWFTPDKKQIEPAASAAAFCEALENMP